MFSLMISIEGQKNSKDILETKLGKIIIETSTWYRKYSVMFQKYGKYY